mgnify:FL=1|jgi:glycosyltransferase involved in cell wall biosynthesis
MKKIFYWSPYLTNVATIEAVINSIKGVKKYSKFFDPILINVCGEFDNYKNDLLKLDIEVIDLVFFSYHKFLPTKGFLQSRLSFLIIFIVSFIPLFLLIRASKPDYLIFHLITSLPILVSNLIKKKTKFILRISGLPKYNLFRKFLWKNLGKKIYKVTCPTNGTINDLRLLKIFNDDKIILLRDPIINIKELLKMKNKKNYLNFDNKDFSIVAIGRLTKQKNFKLLIQCFDKILNLKKNSKLFIIGEGEQRDFLQKLIEKKKLSQKIFLLGFQKNVFNYLKNANLFILSSLWEDPGWVLMEAAMCNTLILSSNCRNGPKEFLEDNRGGVLFENNSIQDFLSKFKQIIELNQKQIKEKKFFSKKKTKLFTYFNHYKKLNLILK